MIQTRYLGWVVVLGCALPCSLGVGEGHAERPNLRHYDDWVHVDDGYFDPFTFDWGLGTRQYNFSAAVEARAAHRQGQLGHRRLETVTCNDPQCACSENPARSDPDCGTSPDLCPCCVRCTQLLDLCGRVGDFIVEDKYYPRQFGIAGSCDNIQDRIGRLDIFGRDKTFRDSDMCRDLALEYICAFWASESLMYDNRCSRPGVDVALYPCRSMCMKLAVSCANNPDYKDLCERIPCCKDGDLTCDAAECFDVESGIITDTERCEVYEYAEFTQDYYSAGCQLQAGIALLMGMCLGIVSWIANVM